MVDMDAYNAAKAIAAKVLAAKGLGPDGKPAGISNLVDYGPGQARLQAMQADAAAAFPGMIPAGGGPSAVQHPVQWAGDRPLPQLASAGVGGLAGEYLQGGGSTPLTVPDRPAWKNPEMEQAAQAAAREAAGQAAPAVATPAAMPVPSVSRAAAEAVGGDPAVAMQDAVRGALGRGEAVKDEARIGKAREIVNQAFATPVDPRVSAPAVAAGRGQGNFESRDQQFRNTGSGLADRNIQGTRSTPYGEHPLDAMAAREAFRRRAALAPMQPNAAIMPPKAEAPAPAGAWYGNRTGASPEDLSRVTTMLNAAMGNRGVPPAGTPIPLPVDPAERKALVEAARANRQLPVDEQISMPIMGRLPTQAPGYVPRTLDGKPLDGSDSPATPAAQAAPLAMSPEGVARLQEHRQRLQDANAEIRRRAGEKALARGTRMGFTSEGQRARQQTRDTMAQGAQNTRDLLGLQLEGQRADNTFRLNQQAMAQRAQEDERMYQRRREQMNEWRMADAAARVAEQEAATLASVNPHTPAAKAARMKADNARALANTYSPVATGGSAPAPATPATSPPTVSGAAAQAVGPSTDAAAKHAAILDTLGTLEARRGTPFSPAEKIDEYIRQIGGPNALTPEVLEQMRAEFGAGATEDARVKAAWGNPALVTRGWAWGPSNSVQWPAWLANILSLGALRGINQALD